MDLTKLYAEWLNQISQQIADSKYSDPTDFIGCRNYHHFDCKITLDNCQHNPHLRHEVCATRALKTHKFWPFIRLDQKTRHFTRDLVNQPITKTKLRKIMYASHVDSIIMAFYAWLLRQNYEKIINSGPAKNSVIGYRRIPLDSRHNKSNIDFAQDIYRKIQHTNDVVLFCLDIENFFDNLDHDLLKKSVTRFLGDIPAENLKPILKAVTKYRYIFKSDIESQLGPNRYWTSSNLYNQKLKNTTYLHRNRRSKGIPQGSPISDILANIYLYEFDIWLAKTVQCLHGTYRRYSDDILIIVPKSRANKLYQQICEKISGPEFKLNISKNKTEAFHIDTKHSIFDDITKNYVPGYAKYRQSVQYLGFLINPYSIKIRAGSIANYYRKETRRTKYNQKLKYIYFKTASRKLGKPVTKQFHKIRQRTKTIHAAHKDARPSS